MSVASPFSSLDSSIARLLAACTASMTMPRKPAFSNVRMACIDVPAGEHTSSFN